MFNEHSTEAIVKTKSWGFWLILALVITGAYTMVFGVITVQQLNEELVVEEYVDMNQFIPFYDWFNGDTSLQNPALETPIVELNNYTLIELFETSDISNIMNNNPTTTTWTVPDLYEKVISSEHYIETRIVSNISANDKIYVIWKYTNLNTNRYISFNFINVNGTYTTYGNVVNITNFEYKTIYTMPNNVGTLDLRLRYSPRLTLAGSPIYLGVDDLLIGKFYQPKVINLTTLGISSLTVAQMDEYYNQYEYYKNYTDFDIYSLDAYKVSRETLIYYHELYQKLLVLQGERAPVKIVSVNPAYNVELGASIMATLKNTFEYIQSRADALVYLYNDISNILGDIGKWFS